MNDTELNARHARRLAAEDRYLGRLEKAEKKAMPLIGELCREGQTVYYVVLRNGKTKEADSPYKLTDFLRRNKYI